MEGATSETGPKLTCVTTSENRSSSEIRIRDESGAFRILSVAKFADAIYVLHCFQKKTEKTSKADVELAAKRYRELLKELGQ